MDDKEYVKWVKAHPKEAKNQGLVIVNGKVEISEPDYIRTKRRKKK